MSSSNNSSGPKADRKERLGAALRANLHRRKEGRKEGRKESRKEARKEARKEGLKQAHKQVLTDDDAPSPAQKATHKEIDKEQE
ncbi:hypothetical protein IMCC14465_06140 [alpha proteobacterium IMCC14465]|uniref:Uncharacterized protein n=1 Tax=alpha proteobacterium IMCC14465 TaxID=1220535 RepID=J9DF93_9PROT|nr:hypothetical protein IMCC14465_06140 [alpha proteobacterium IMCC14465]